jgi:hypothetical protein
VPPVVVLVVVPDDEPAGSAEVELSGGAPAAVVDV